MPPKKDSKKEVLLHSHRHNPNPITQAYPKGISNSNSHSPSEAITQNHPT